MTQTRALILPRPETPTVFLGWRDLDLLNRTSIYKPGITTITPTLQQTAICDEERCYMDADEALLCKCIDYQLMSYCELEG